MSRWIRQQPRPSAAPVKFKVSPEEFFQQDAKQPPAREEAPRHRISLSDLISTRQEDTHER